MNLGLFHLINGCAGHLTLDTIVMALNRNSIVRDIMLIVPYVFLWYRHPRVEVRTKLIGGLAGGIVAVLLARGLSHTLPFEARPMYDPASGFTPLVTAVAPDMEAWSSFPSDTAAFSIALCLGLFWVSRGLSVALSVLALFVFCLPRIYAGIHYPYDIVVGLAIGAMAAWAMHLPALDRVWRVPLQLEGQYRPWFYSASFVVVAELSQMFDGARSLLFVLRTVL